MKIPCFFDALIIGRDDNNWLLQVYMLDKVVNHVVSRHNGLEGNSVVEKARLMALAGPLQVHRDDAINPFEDLIFLLKTGRRWPLVSTTLCTTVAQEKHM